TVEKNFQPNGIHICVYYARNERRVTVISMTWGGATTTFRTLSGGGQGRVLSLCFLRFFIGRFVSSWARDSNTRRQCAGRTHHPPPSCLAVQRHTSLNRVGLNSV